MTPNTRDRDELREALRKAVGQLHRWDVSQGWAVFNAILADIDARLAALNAVPPEPLDGLDPEYEVAFGQPLCADCRHPHADAAWVNTDPDDGTCWSAGSLVCGCPKFITPAVRRRRAARSADVRAALPTPGTDR